MKKSNRMIMAILAGIIISLFIFNIILKQKVDHAFQQSASQRTDQVQNNNSRQ